jgi:hypothetical protein
MSGVGTLLQILRFLLGQIFSYRCRDAHGRPNRHISYNIVQHELVDGLLGACVVTTRLPFLQIAENSRNISSDFRRLWLVCYPTGQYIYVCNA